ncbi:MAG: hypothetical protein ACXWMX_03035, partial [Candidatus Limnocylindrales bacterium]
DGPTQMSDRALTAALDEIHSTPQRRAWWPARRLPKMNTPIRFAAGAATLAIVVVVALAVDGFNLLPGSGGVGGSSSPPLPTATGTPRATATPTPSVGVLTLSDAASPLAPGSYVAADPFLARVSFTVPAGWQGNIGGPYAVFLGQADGPGGLALQIFNKVYADPCHSDKGFLDPLPGQSVDDLAMALASLPGLTATTPTAVTMAGLQGKQLTLTAPASSSGCTAGVSRVWELPLGATLDLTPGEVVRVWILDVDGQRVVIDAPETPSPTTTTAQVQAILDSIRIAPGATGEWPVTLLGGSVVADTTSLLAPGTYVAADPFLLRVTFTVPAGWHGKIGGPYAVFLQQAAGPGAVNFQIFDKVDADPCHSDKGFLNPLPGSSVDDLATALARLPGLTATTPTAVTLGGYQGKQLTLTAAASASGCTGGAEQVWELPLGATNTLTAGEIDKVWILDVGGQRLVIEAPQMPGQAAAITAQVQAILDTIGIAQLN